MLSGWVDGIGLLVVTCSNYVHTHAAMRWVCGVPADTFIYVGLEDQSDQVDGVDSDGAQIRLPFPPGRACPTNVYTLLTTYTNRKDASLQTHTHTHAKAVNAQTNILRSYWIQKKSILYGQIYIYIWIELIWHLIRPPPRECVLVYSAQRCGRGSECLLFVFACLLCS